MKTLLILLLTAATAMAAHPTGTVTRAVAVDTNGVLWGSDTNFAAMNGIATTGTVAASISAILAGTNSIIVDGAGVPGVNGVYVWTEEQILPWFPLPHFALPGTAFIIYPPAEGYTHWELYATNLDTYYVNAASNVLFGTWTADGQPGPGPIVTPGGLTNILQYCVERIRTSAWITNQVPGFGGTTNTLIYLGAP